MEFAEETLKIEDYNIIRLNALYRCIGFGETMYYLR